MNKLKKAGDILASLIVATGITIIFNNPWFFAVVTVVYFAIQEHRRGG